MGNIAAEFEASAQKWPGKDVLVRGGQTLTWRTLDLRAGALAEDLADRGVGPGDPVLLSFGDSLSLTIALLAALKTGATATPLNQRLGDEEKAAIIADLGPKLVCDRLASGEKMFGCAETAIEDDAFILYTSGSTGAPKGAVLSHRATSLALSHWRGPILDLGPDDVVLSTLPPAHSFGVFGSILAPMLAGAKIVFLDRFSPEGVLAAIAEHRVTVFPGVATMFQRILDCPDLVDADTSSLRFAASGAAPCSWELAEQWRAATGARIIRGYGMTELFRPISYTPLSDRDVPDAIGRAVADVELRIVDKDGDVLPPGEIGELWINSPARLTGYLNQPEQTRAVLQGDWFKTGDLATLDGDGFVRIKGRIKDIILRGGYTVAAGSVEKVLMAHPDVAEAAVIGVPHRELGEEIAAYVTLQPGGGATSDSLIAFCKERMANFNYPRHVRVLDEMPKSPMGKVLKQKLRLSFSPRDS